MCVNLSCAHLPVHEEKSGLTTVTMTTLWRARWGLGDKADELQGARRRALYGRRVPIRHGQSRTMWVSLSAKVVSACQKRYKKTRRAANTVAVGIAVTKKVRCLLKQVCTFVRGKE